VRTWLTFSRVFMGSVQKGMSSSGTFWRSTHALFDDDARLGVGGDWSAGGRVEGAFLSGVALAGRVLSLPAEATPALRPS
jgi:hypothetical protein